LTAKFTVLVDDTFHYMDTDERWTLGAFATAEEAVAASKAIVNAYLGETYAPSMNAEVLFLRYTQFGEDPFIVASDGERVAFSAWDYAKARSRELAG
jgi:hypothetical protein